MTARKDEQRGGGGTEQTLNHLEIRCRFSVRYYIALYRFESCPLHKFNQRKSVAWWFEPTLIAHLKQNKMRNRILKTLKLAYQFMLTMIFVYNYFTSGDKQNVLLLTIVVILFNIWGEVISIRHND
jgi:hypothetical protein